MKIEDRIKRLEKAIAGCLGYIDLLTQPNMNEEGRLENALMINQTFEERSSIFKEVKKSLLSEEEAEPEPESEEKLPINEDTDKKVALHMLENIEKKKIKSESIKLKAEKKDEG